MDFLRLEDQFYPLLMRIYQIKYLTEDIREYSTCSLSRGDAVQRYHALYSLLGDVMESAVSDMEEFQGLLTSERRSPKN